jgi:hypothetical protein
MNGNEQATAMGRKQIRDKVVFVGAWSILDRSRPRAWADTSRAKLDGL